MAANLLPIFRHMCIKLTRINHFYSRKNYSMILYLFKFKVFNGIHGYSFNKNLFRNALHLRQISLHVIKDYR